MDDTIYPELPPRHKWWQSSRGEVTIQAERTTWVHGADERVLYAKTSSGDKWLVHVWKKTQSPGIWELMQICDTKQEAVNWMVAALMLGMSDYELLEE